MYTRAKLVFFPHKKFRSPVGKKRAMEGGAPGEAVDLDEDEGDLAPDARIAAAIQAVQATEWGAPVSETGWAVIRALCWGEKQRKRACLTTTRRQRQAVVSMHACCAHHTHKHVKHLNERAQACLYSDCCTTSAAIGCILCLLILAFRQRDAARDEP